MNERPQRTEVLRFRVTPDEKAWLQEEARLFDRSVAQIIRQALKEYRERAES